MTAQAWGALMPEQITVTSGLDGVTEITLRNNAWIVMEMRGLTIPQILIDNRISPGGVGSTPLEGAELELRTSLPFQMTGTVEADNETVPTAIVDGRVGMRRHWVYLTQHLFRPSIEGPLDAVFQSIDPDEAEIEFGIQFATPEIPGAWVSEWTCNLPVVLHGGALIAEAAGS